MTILTQTGRYYEMKIDEQNGSMLRLVCGGPKPLLVTDICNLCVGERAIIKGYLIDPATNSPMTKYGKFHYTTSPVAKIIP